MRTKLGQPCSTSKVSTEPPGKDWQKTQRTCQRLKRHKVSLAEDTNALDALINAASSRQAKTEVGTSQGAVESAWIDPSWAQAVKVEPVKAEVVKTEPVKAAAIHTYKMHLN